MEINLEFEEGDEVWVDNKYLIFNDQPGEVVNVTIDVNYEVKLGAGNIVNRPASLLEDYDGDQN